MVQLWNNSLLVKDLPGYVSALAIFPCLPTRFVYSHVMFMYMYSNLHVSTVQATRMGRMSLSTRSHVVLMWKSGYKLGKIQQCLEEDSLTVSKKSLCLLIRKYKQTGSVANKKATRQPTKLVDVHYQFINAAMANNNEKWHHMNPAFPCK